jgi:hypothetical protein
MATGAFGSGRFGQWLRAGDGPAYRYTHDRDNNHYHLIGNDRISAIYHAAGHVQVHDWSRGFRCLNFAGHGEDPSGGYLHVETGAACLTTLGEGPVEVRFGAGYFEKRGRCGMVALVERVEAPHGDSPVLIHAATLTNEGEESIHVRVTACWTVRHHPVVAIPVLPKRFIGLAQRWRARFARRFKTACTWDEALCCRAAVYTPPRHAPPPGKRTHRDWHPKPVFLACLEGDATPAAPGVMHQGVPMGLQTSVTLGPGETRTLRFLFGTAAPEEMAGVIAHWRGATPARRAEVLFEGEAVPEWLSREIEWHSAYLQAGVYYVDYFGAHTIDQGSAYSFLQGATGAPRDFALFILPMVYLRPELAKDLLRFLLRAQRAKNGSFPYAFYGHGATSGAGAHSWSSDLDLFVFWALSEYLNATRDHAFLDEIEPYYPIEQGNTGSVLEHVRAAFRHLTETIGMGPNGLLRCGTGDWNDVLCGFSMLPPVTAWRGESTLNAGLATLVLPAMAGAVQGHDAELAARMREFAARQTEALKKQWTGAWAARGTLGYFGRRLGVDRLFLDTQPFGVLGGVWTGEHRALLFESIRVKCVEPQKTGARCLDRPYRAMHLKPGVDTNGGVWAAIDSWLAWAWSLEEPQAAWRFFLSTTMAARAEAYPDNWYGIWSGPDAFNGCDHPRPGETSNFVFTPMAEFPMFNMNRHSGPLLDVIKLAGINPTGEGITIDPKLPFDEFTLDLPLLKLDYAKEVVTGVYRPQRDTRARLAVRPPAKSAGLEVIVHGKPVPHVINEAGLAVFDADVPGEVAWEIRTAREAPTREH